MNAICLMVVLICVRDIQYVLGSPVCVRDIQYVLETPNICVIDFQYVLETPNICVMTPSILPVHVESIGHQTHPPPPVLSSLPVLSIQSQSTPSGTDCF